MGIFPNFGSTDDLRVLELTNVCNHAYNSKPSYSVLSTVVVFTI
jgi:hypothetical protein